MKYNFFLIILSLILLLLIYNLPSFNKKKNIIYCFWTGNNTMSPDRLKSFKKLKEKSKCNVVLVTPKNLNEYILPEHPLHPAYEYLSLTHRADYLRTYFMHFIGGGYSDIKETTGSWVQSFEDLKNTDYWICGYKEVPGGVAYGPHGDKWEELVGNCAYICKPGTPLTREWYSDMIKLLDLKLEDLRKNPAKKPDDQKEFGEGGYPIEWNEMLGRIFHKVCYKYKHYLLNTLPILIFNNYR